MKAATSAVTRAAISPFVTSHPPCPSPWRSRMIRIQAGTGSLWGGTRPHSSGTLGRRIPQMSSSRDRMIGRAVERLARPTGRIRIIADQNRRAGETYPLDPAFGTRASRIRTGTPRPPALNARQCRVEPDLHRSTCRRHPGCLLASFQSHGRPGIASPPVA